MKTTRHNRGALILSAMLVTALFGPPSDTLAADVHGARGGATQLKELKTVGDVETVKSGDTVVMACPKCKTMMETRMEAGPKGATPRQTQIATHACPGCGARFETTGHGKAKQEKVTHVCPHCGSKQAFCAVHKSAENVGRPGQ